MSLSLHYAKAKTSMMGISPKDAVDLGEDLLIAGATGAVLGLMAASTGGFDKKIAGMTIPMDGAASLALGLVGLSMHSPELRTASIAAAGSASARTFEGIFKKTMGAHGDFDSNDIPFGWDGAPPQMTAGFGAGAGAPAGQFSSYGFGNERGSDRLMRAAYAL